MFLVLALLVNLNQATAQSDNATKIIGTWTLDFYSSMDLGTKSSKMKYNELEADARDRIKSSFSARKIIFKQGGGYVMEIKPGTRINGSWELIADGKTLLIKLDNGESVKLRIDRIDTTSLTLNLGEDQPNTLFAKWHLTKN